MHFPRVSSEVLMLPASFSLSPNVLVLLHLSEPARSHRENLQRGEGKYEIRTRQRMTGFPPVPEPYSESHLTAASSIFSSLMVKMLWLRGELLSDLQSNKKRKKLLKKANQLAFCLKTGSSL